MDTESCKVLVQTDDAGRVTAINSDAFVSGDGWTQIDEGEGDRYRHAQNNYLLERSRTSAACTATSSWTGWLRSGHRPRWMRTLTHCPRRR